MNDSNRRRYEACKRCVQWAADNAALVVGILATKFAALAAKVDEIESFAGALVSAVGESSGEFGQKGLVREDLIEACSRVADAARAAEPDHPGIQDRFRFRRNMSDADLLATARGFVEGDAEWGTIIKDYFGGDSWAADITALADLFETAFNEAASASGSKVAANAELNEAVNEAMQIKRTCNYLVNNHVTNTGALAAWASAAHVEKAPESPTPPTPPTP